MTNDMKITLALTLVGLLHLVAAAKPLWRTRQLPTPGSTHRGGVILWMLVNSVIGLVYVGLALWIFLWG
jgi:hypothetical protein